MVEHVETVIIGAGQAGLATSYHLTQLDRHHIILEKTQEITSAWRRRWDSFTLVLPNWTVQMPGFAYDGPDPNGFMNRDELVKYMEQFVETFHPEVRYGWNVTSVQANPDGGNFLISSDEASILADNVVVAVGTFQEPKIPPVSTNISDQIIQIHSDEYRNPDALPEGAALVVGTGQSGCQIAEELYQSGRNVYLCVGGATPVPRRYRGKDIIWWLDRSGFFEHTVEMLPSSKARFAANPFVSGKEGGRTLSLHKFALDGVNLLGRLIEADNHMIKIAPDLYDNLAKGDKFVGDIKIMIDEYIEKENIEAEESALEAASEYGYQVVLEEELNLFSADITSIIWATGYKFDFSWIELSLLDDDGYPIQKRGISDFPGVYFIGLNWLYKRKSGLLYGVGEAAGYVAESIAERS